MQSAAPTNSIGSASHSGCPMKRQGLLMKIYVNTKGKIRNLSERFVIPTHRRFGVLMDLPGEATILLSGIWVVLQYTLEGSIEEVSHTDTSVTIRPVPKPGYDYAFGKIVLHLQQGDLVAIIAAVDESGQTQPEQTAASFLSSDSEPAGRSVGDAG